MIYHTRIMVTLELIHCFLSFVQLPTVHVSVETQKSFNTNHILELFTPQPLKAYQCFLLPVFPGRGGSGAEEVFRGSPEGRGADSDQRHCSAEIWT